MVDIKIGSFTASSLQPDEENKDMDALLLSGSEGPGALRTLDRSRPGSINIGGFSDSAPSKQAQGKKRGFQLRSLLGLSWRR